MPCSNYLSNFSENTVHCNKYSLRYTSHTEMYAGLQGKWLLKMYSKLKFKQPDISSIKYQIQNFKQICPKVLELFHAYRKTEGGNVIGSLHGCEDSKTCTDKPQTGHACTDYSGIHNKDLKQFHHHNNLAKRILYTFLYEADYSKTTSPFYKWVR